MCSRDDTVVGNAKGAMEWMILMQFDLSLNLVEQKGGQLMNPFLYVYVNLAKESIREFFYNFKAHVFPVNNVHLRRLLYRA